MRIAQVPAITWVDEELARKPGCANAPGPPHVEAQILKCLDSEAGPLGELAIFDLAPHARQASLATDRLQEVPSFPGTRITPGEPGADRQASAGPERPVGLVEEMLLFSHMLGALDGDNMVKARGLEAVVEPIPLATRISAAFCTPIQTCPMASIRWTPWPRRRAIGATRISELPIIRNPPITGGLSVEEIAEQHAAIDRLNAGYGGGFRVFKGIESDILLDGALDYPDEVLQRFDFVVASVHSRFRLDRKTQTARIIRAVENPYTTILGHMTGRQLLRRPGYEVDIEEILAACATHGVAVEINANPWRLELDWRWHDRALERGCMMSINPDAHSTDEIDHTHWGVEMARKGGVPKERILNCLNLPRFAAFLAERLRRAANGHAPPAKPADARLRPNAGPKATPLKMPGREARRRGAN
jgi:histidinol phosphatase-like PHP family hydrolase